MLFSKPTTWERLWPFHNETLWEKYEPVWYVLIALLIVVTISLGLKVAIANEVVGVESLYISPSSYSHEPPADFFMSQSVSDHMSEVILDNNRKA